MVEHEERLRYATGEGTSNNLWPFTFDENDLVTCVVNAAGDDKLMVCDENSTCSCGLTRPAT